MKKDYFLWIFLVSTYMYNIRYNSILYVPCSITVRFHSDSYKKVMRDLHCIMSPLQEIKILPPEVIYEIYNFL